MKRRRFLCAGGSEPKSVSITHAARFQTTTAAGFASQSDPIGALACEPRERSERFYEIATGSLQFA